MNRFSSLLREYRNYPPASRAKNRVELVILVLLTYIAYAIAILFGAWWWPAFITVGVLWTIVVTIIVGKILGLFR